VPLIVPTPLREGAPDEVRDLGQAHVVQIGPAVVVADRQEPGVRRDRHRGGVPARLAGDPRGRPERASHPVRTAQRAFHCSAWFSLTTPQHQDNGGS
jgi:hypothetical protein